MGETARPAPAEEMKQCQEPNQENPDGGFPRRDRVADRLAVLVPVSAAPHTGGADSAKLDVGSLRGSTNRATPLTRTPRTTPFSPST